MVLIFSLVVSIKTTATTYVKIKTEEKVKFFPLLPKVFLSVRALTAYLVRTAFVIGYFVPFLGLLDVLAHYKADELMAENDENTNSDENENKELYEKYTGVRVG